MIYCYIWNYYICKYVKTFKNWYNSMLKFLSILIYPCINIIFDFLIKLFVNNNHYIILNWLTKKYYILYIINKNIIIMKATIYL